MSKFCPNCGTGLDEAAKFCPGCGTQTAAAQPEQRQPYPLNPPQAPMARAKDVIKSGAFLAKRRISNIFAVALMALGTLLLAVIILFRVSSGLVLVGIGLLIGGLIILLRNRNTKKKMEALGIDDSAIRQAESEMLGAGTWRIWDVTITSNWVMQAPALAEPVLYPLRAVAAVENGYIRDRNGRDYYVKLLFNNGTVHRLFCTRQQRDEIIALLAWLCPWANHRPNA